MIHQPPEPEHFKGGEFHHLGLPFVFVLDVLSMRHPAPSAALQRRNFLNSMKVMQ